MRTVYIVINQRCPTFLTGGPKCTDSNLVTAWIRSFTTNKTQYHKFFGGGGGGTVAPKWK